ncbi:YrbL family protein [Marinobacter sp. ATCH36]|uniref:YrbL family protein n=1 Tax=Marinobacter sp. ATCH36 TaxID=2945106 RepID=UPI002021D31F|nr:YrbL family protein [Marinobacter sp. ATCH36]MCL7945952.1 PhoP regulatory network YrbL family protein [Marinobacter sp. ATCH36]
MIDLSELKPFASGSNRHCYQHPDDPALCLKVLRPENIEARYQRQAWPKKALGKARIDDNRQELRAYRQHAISKLLTEDRGSLVWAHLPRFHGAVQTSLGAANVSELITGSNGSPAETLEHYLQRQGFDLPAQNAVERFCDWLRQTGILTRNLLPHNLVIAERNGQPELFLVDGLGAPAIPDKLAAILAWRRRYISRRIKRFYLRIDWETGNRNESWETSQKL